MDHRQGHKQVHRTAAGKVNFKRAFYSILPQLEFDRSDQGGAEPKKSCKKPENTICKSLKSTSTSTLGTSVSTGLVARKRAKGKLVRPRVKLLNKFMLADSATKHSNLVFTGCQDVSGLYHYI